MPAGRIRIAMTDNIIISEVDGPPDVVKCFIREEDGLEGQSRELVVIGLEYIDVFEGVEQDEARKKLRLRLSDIQWQPFISKIILHLTEDFIFC